MRTMVMAGDAPDLSIVVPVYNPQHRIFTRVLDAIAALDSSGLTVECVIVDNASQPALSQLSYVGDFLAASPWVRLVREERQGLTFARLAGISATSGHLVVIFDDDNVPSRSYLQAALECFRQFPTVGVWGPGTVDVELLDPVPEWLRQRVRDTHSQRHETSAQYGCIPASWQPFYPIGMGQVIRRDVADAYRYAVETGALNATDRQGGSLASGGDIQIVWQAINMGLAAGVHPDLAMTHLIPESRATIKYLNRLAFGCGMSYHPALAQSFPATSGKSDVASAFDSGTTPAGATTTWQDVSNLSQFVARRVARGRIRFLSIDFANLLGLTCGRLLVEGSGTNHWTFKLARRLGFA